MKMNFTNESVVRIGQKRAAVCFQVGFFPNQELAAFKLTIFGIKHSFTINKHIECITLFELQVWTFAISVFLEVK